MEPSAARSTPANPPRRGSIRNSIRYGTARSLRGLHHEPATRRLGLPLCKDIDRTVQCVSRPTEDARGASFVSVTQQFNTTTSMGRLTLNVLLSFAQFEREVIGDRIRGKIRGIVADLITGGAVLE